MEKIWHNCDIVTMRSGCYNIINNGVIKTNDRKIVWIGTYAEIEDEISLFSGEMIDLGGMIVTPGFIDAHTHLVFGADRSEEFEARLKGVSYKEIAKRGGGINSTVNATRLASEDELYNSAKKRIDHLIQDGVTTLEIKSGYGLDLNTELKMLRAIERLKKNIPIKIHITYLAAHAIPNDYHNNGDLYIDYVINEVLPAVMETCEIDAIDAFCENIAFSVEQTRRLFDAAKAYNIPVKLHAEQLSSMHGSTLAASYQALSADHLEYATESDVVAMSENGTVAVLLPGAFYTLREKQLPPIDLFRKKGVKIALASDLNPGTSPMLSLRLALNMACILFSMTPEEALAGVTYNASFALGEEEQIGTIEVGKEADFIAWDIAHPAELSYWLGGTLNNVVVSQGNIVSHF